MVNDDILIIPQLKSVKEEEKKEGEKKKENKEGTEKESSKC